MTKRISPQRQANEISIMLNTVFGQDRFPVRIHELAIEYSRKRYPDDPLTDVLGGNLPGFEGALCPAQGGKKGWGILYNDAIDSPGRVNFTLAHEFGHYLLHRLEHPEGIYCTEEDMRSWDSKNRQIESEANEFAANLLMPFDDFRRQIAARDKADMDMLSRLLKNSRTVARVARRAGFSSSLVELSEGATWLVSVTSTKTPSRRPSSAAC